MQSILHPCTSPPLGRRLAAALLFLPAATLAGSLNFQPPATRIAQQITDLHAWLMLIIIVIFIVVFGMMFWATWKHRKSLGHSAKPFHENTAVEIAWTVVPALILAGMSWPAAKLVIEQRGSGHPDLTIKATGYQWYWGYDYLDHGIGFKSHLATPRAQIDNYGAERPLKNEHYLLEVDQPLVVPVGKKVRMLTTSNDVIHSWGMPAFGVKQDAIPGFIRDTWFRAEQTGIYRGQCVELCGRDHGFMPIVVQVVSEADFQQWLARQQAQKLAAQLPAGLNLSREQLLAKGKTVYDSNCAACHMPDGKGNGPFPALSGSKIVTGPKAGHLGVVLTGRGMMPAWAGLSDIEIAAVLSYERNALGNKTGDLIRPEDVKAARK